MKPHRTQTRDGASSTAYLQRDLLRPGHRGIEAGKKLVEAARKRFRKSPSQLSERRYWETVQRVAIAQPELAGLIRLDPRTPRLGAFGRCLAQAALLVRRYRRLARQEGISKVFDEGSWRGYPTRIGRELQYLSTQLSADSSTGHPTQSDAYREVRGQFLWIRKIALGPGRDNGSAVLLLCDLARQSVSFDKPLIQFLMRATESLTGPFTHETFSALLHTSRRFPSEADFVGRVEKMVTRAVCIAADRALSGRGGRDAFFQVLYAAQYGYEPARKLLINPTKPFIETAGALFASQAPAVVDAIGQFPEHPVAAQLVADGILGGQHGKGAHALAHLRELEPRGSATPAFEKRKRDAYGAMTQDLRLNTPAAKVWARDILESIVRGDYDLPIASLACSPCAPGYVGLYLEHAPDSVCDDIIEYPKIDPEIAVLAHAHRALRTPEDQVVTASPPPEVSLAALKRMAARPDYKAMLTSPIAGRELGIAAAAAVYWLLGDIPAARAIDVRGPLSKTLETSIVHSLNNATSDMKLGRAALQELGYPEALQIVTHEAMHRLLTSLGIRPDSLDRQSVHEFMADVGALALDEAAELRRPLWGRAGLSVERYLRVVQQDSADGKPPWVGRESHDIARAQLRAFCEVESDINWRSILHRGMTELKKDPSLADNFARFIQVTLQIRSAEFPIRNRNEGWVGIWSTKAITEGRKHARAA